MNQHSFYIQVALPVPLYTTFDYSITPQLIAHSGLTPLTADVFIGCRVRVPFGRRTLIGIVVSAHAPDYTHTLKAVSQLIDTTPLLPSSLLHILQWAAHYYIHPIGEVIAAALPAFLRQGRALDFLATHWRTAICTSVAEQEEFNAHVQRLSRAPLQKKAFELLQMHDAQGAAENVLRLMGIELRHLHQLEKKGLVERFEEAHTVHIAPVETRELPLTPNTEQQHAIHAILAKQHQYAAFLLDGLTGSGKTEVYLQVIEPILKAGKQAMVLVPEIGLTPQTISRFERRFDAHIVTMHSAMTDLARMKAWQLCATGEAQLLIGTRSAIFAPLPNIGVIIIDEEHDLSFKQQESFRYHAREIAMVRAQHIGCPIVLGSATPSLETLYWVEKQKMQHVVLPARAGGASLSAIECVDLRGQKKLAGLAPRTLSAIEHNVQQGHQTLIFINRRGYSPVLLCDGCGWQADCPRCDAHLTLHTQPQHYLRCHHCNYYSAVPKHCASCGSANLVPIGIGTVRLEEFLTSHFKNTPIIRVDRDSTKNKHGWNAIYEQVHHHPNAILVGTQMLAKGHHFPQVTLVVIIDGDTGLYSADFRAPERAAQLIIQVAGRAGRAQKKGHVLLQTWQPDHPFLHSLLQGHYHTFAQQLLQERKAACLPPVHHGVLIRAESIAASKTEYALTALIQQLQTHSLFSALHIWGPTPAPMQRKAGIYRAQLFLFCASRPQLHALMHAIWLPFLKSDAGKHVKLSLDVDPQEIN